MTTRRTWLLTAVLASSLLVAACGTAPRDTASSPKPRPAGTVSEDTPNALSPSSAAGLGIFPDLLEPANTVFPSNATVVFSFDNGSPDPAFKMDMVATFTSDEGTITGVRNGVPAESSAPVPASAWQMIEGTYSTLLELPDAEDVGDCEGGSRYAVTVLDGSVPVHEVDYRVCEQINIESARALSQWITPLMDSLPEPTPVPSPPSDE